MTASICSLCFCEGGDCCCNSLEMILKHIHPLLYVLYLYLYLYLSIHLPSIYPGLSSQALTASPSPLQEMCSLHLDPGLAWIFMDIPFSSSPYLQGWARLASGGNSFCIHGLRWGSGRILTSKWHYGLVLQMQKQSFRPFFFPCLYKWFWDMWTPPLGSVSPLQHEVGNPLFSCWVQQSQI